MAKRKHDPMAFPFEGSPAGKVIQAFGGVTRCAEAVGRNKSSVSRWLQPLGEGGTGGHVPVRVQGTVLREAQARGLDITAADLIAP